MKTPSIVLALLFAFAATSADAADTNTYTNPSLGITVTKPADWRFATAEQHADNLQRAKLKDEDLQKLVQKYAATPLVMMMKYAEPFDDLNPSFKVNIRPLGNLSGENPTAILNVIAKPLQTAFEDFTMVTPPKEITVAGHKAAYMKIHFSMAIPDGRQFPTCSELWVIPRGKNFFMIGAGTRQDEKTGKREEIEKIITSLKLE